MVMWILCSVWDSLALGNFWKVLAYKYLGNPAAALVANANLGGDNCHRGSLLGAILGASPIPLTKQVCANRNLLCLLSAWRK